MKFTFQNGIEVETDKVEAAQVDWNTYKVSFIYNNTDITITYKTKEQAIDDYLYLTEKLAQ